MRKEMLTSVNRQFQTASTNRKLVLATVLDPRFKNRLLCDNELATQARVWLKEDCQQLLDEERKRDAQQAEDGNNANDSDEEGQPPKKKRKVGIDDKEDEPASSLWDFFTTEATQSEEHWSLQRQHQPMDLRLFHWSLQRQHQPMDLRLFHWSLQRQHQPMDLRLFH